MRIINYYRGGTDRLTGFVFNTEEKIYRTFSIPGKDWAEVTRENGNVYSGPKPGFHNPAELEYHFPTKSDMEIKLHELQRLGFQEENRMALDFGVVSIPPTFQHVYRPMTKTEARVLARDMIAALPPASYNTDPHAPSVDIYADEVTFCRHDCLIDDKILTLQLTLQLIHFKDEDGDRYYGVTYVPTIDGRVQMDDWRFMYTDKATIPELAEALLDLHQTFNPEYLEDCFRRYQSQRNAEKKIG